MTRRLDGLRRVLKVQVQVRRRAEWHKADAERAVAEASDARLALAAFMAADDLVTGPLAGLAQRQGERLVAREMRAQSIAAEAAEAALAAQSREKLVERRLDAVAREERAWHERKDLERLIEGLAGRAGADGATTEE